MGKYLDKIRQHEGTQPTETVEAEDVLRQQQKALAPSPTIHPGDRITWAVHGTLRGPAMVDFLHTDSDGKVWAFVTYQGTWRAVSEAIIATIEPPESPHGEP